MSVTIHIPRDARSTIRDALAVELLDQANQVQTDLQDFLSGSSVGLIDARCACERLAQVVAAIDQLGPNAWQVRPGDPEEEHDG